MASSVTPTMAIEFEVALSKLLSLLFLSIVSFQLGLVAVHDEENHRHGRPAADIPGFISIDCGAFEDSVDEKTGLPYQSDKGLIDSGISKQISPEFYGNLSLQYRNVRSFPDGMRNCYTLEPKAGGNNNYLIRASFVYGNYDGKNLAPVFDLYLGVNFWATVQLSQEFQEVITVPSTNRIDVCLVNTGQGVPYISTLELRQLDNALYRIENGRFLIRWLRYDAGGKARIRYPQDVYDRFWEPLPCEIGSNDLRSTNATITASSDDDPFKLPEAMLQTACQAPNSSSSVNTYWLGSFQFYFCFYFAEIEKLNASQFREMRIVINKVHTIAPSIKLEYLKSRNVCSDGLLSFPDQENKFSLSATSTASLPPIMSGFESFFSLKTSNASTFLQDINAIMDIKHQYILNRNWQGDPCNPTAFSWDGLNCSNANPSRIISLNLGGSKLAGHIAISLLDLTALESLDLSHNELTGSIPDSLAQLPHLRILNLNGNNFTGGVPDALLQKSKDGTLDLRYSELCLSPPCKKKRKFSIPFLASIISAFVLVIPLGVLVIFTRKRKEEIYKSKKMVLMELNNRQFNYLELVNITDNFKTTIGEGGFGKVFLGALEDGTLVAVKLLSMWSNQGYREFQAEVQLQMIAHHRNLVSLVGYCDDGDNRALIYEYMTNGNLQEHLSERSTKILSWSERLQIAVDVAQGLEYLHNGCKLPIIHRDMKSTNILLNEKMQAKIADLGLSRSFPSESASHLSTSLAGTFGYIDPEIHSSRKFTKKGDVYSFGIVLFELITGQPAIISGEEDNVHILSWVKPLIEEGNIENIMDSRLQDAIESGSACKVVEVALSCTSPTSKRRPDMSFVVTELAECLKMAQSKTRQMPSDGHEKYSYTSMSSELFLDPR